MNEHSYEQEKAGEKEPLLPGRKHRQLPNLVSSGSIQLPNSTLIEPPNLARSRWRSIRVMYLTMFLSALTFTITMSTIWPYLQVLDNSATPGYLGWVVAAYSLGQLLASPVLGAWSARRRSAREPLLMSLSLQVLANLFYAYILTIPSQRGVYLMLSRCLIGFASGNAAVVRAYVSGATTLKERTSAMANVSIYQSVGFILGPAIQTALVPLNYPGPVEVTWFHLNMFTTPAFLSAMLAFINLLLVLSIFHEHTVQDQGGIENHLNINDDVEERIPEAEVEVNADKDLGPPDYYAVFSTIFFFFIVFFIFTVFETIGTPLVMNMYGWTKEQASLYMGILLASTGILAIGVFIIVKWLSKRFDDRILLIVGYIFCFIGFFIYLPWGDNLPVRGYAPIGPPIHVSVSTPHLHSLPTTTRVPFSMLSSQSIMQFTAAPHTIPMANQDDTTVAFSLQQATDIFSSTTYSNPSLSHDLARQAKTSQSANVAAPIKTSRLVSSTNLATSTKASRLIASTNVATPNKTSHSIASTIVATSIKMSGSVPSSDSTIATILASNSTVPPQGCPWNFNWCGNEPRIELFQFILGTVVICIGYPICNVMTYTLYSKVLGPQPQGLWMGFLTATGSLARTLGPVYVSQIYDVWGPRVTFGSACGVILATLGFCAAAYRRLLPFAITPFRRGHLDSAEDPSPG